MSSEQLNNTIETIRSMVNDPSNADLMNRFGLGDNGVTYSEYTVPKIVEPLPIQKLPASLSGGNSFLNVNTATAPPMSVIAEESGSNSVSGEETKTESPIEDREVKSDVLPDMSTSVQENMEYLDVSLIIDGLMTCQEGLEKLDIKSTAQSNEYSELKKAVFDMMQLCQTNFAVQKSMMKNMSEQIDGLVRYNEILRGTLTELVQSMRSGSAPTIEIPSISSVMPTEGVTRTTPTNRPIGSSSSRVLVLNTEQMLQVEKMMDTKKLSQAKRASYRQILKGENVSKKCIALRTLGLSHLLQEN